MKKILYIVLCIVTLVALGIFYLNNGSLFEKDKIGRDSVIVAFGDSLTAGHGSTEGNDYVSILSRKIERPIINQGISGDTTFTALQRVEEVLELNPDLVIVFLGGNDMLRKTPIEETFSNLDTIVKTFTETGVKVVLVGVPGGVLGDPYKNKFEELAEKYDAIYIPQFLKSIMAKRDLMSDSIHPNDKGYQIVAQNIYDGIKEIIK